MGPALVRQPGIRARTLGTRVTGGKTTLSLGLSFPSCGMDWFVYSFSEHKFLSSCGGLVLCRELVLFWALGLQL